MQPMNWCELQQKYKPQSNALAIGLILMLVSGMHVAFGLLNFSMHNQAWTQGRDQSSILFVIVSWYLAANGGMVIGRVLLPMLGKKVIGFVAIGLFIVSGILYTAAPQMFETILMGRLLAGFGHGLAYLTTIVHGSEIVVKEIRGMLFSSISFMVMAAALTYTSFNMTVELESNSETEFYDPNRVIGIVTLAYVFLAGLIGAFLTYESPVFLIQRNRDMEARKVMMKLRNDTVETYEMLQDYQELKTMIAEDGELTTSIFQDGNLRPLLTILGLRILSVATFNFPLNFVRTTLAQPLLGVFNVCLVITNVRTFVGLFTLFTADIFPRRTFLHVSGIGSAVSLALLAILYTVNENMNSILMAIVVFVFDAMAGLGIAQLTDIYSAEAFPLTKKVDSLLFTTIAENVLQTLLIVSMMDMDTGRGTILAILYTFTVVIGAAVAFLSFRVPETLKKTMRETRDLFRENHVSQPIIYEGRDVPKAGYT